MKIYLLQVDTRTRILLQIFIFYIVCLFYMYLVSLIHYIHITYTIYTIMNHIISSSCNMVQPELILKFALLGGEAVGKTTFVKYLINSMQMKNNEDILEVQSPTFNILNEYEVNGLKILHYDLYRLKDKKELENVGQIKNQTDKLILIEWPELIKDNVSSTISINFAYEDDLYKRSLSISSSNKNLVNGF